jgi:hypothetical protein
MRSFPTVVSVLVLIASAVAPAARAAQPIVTLSIPEAGVVVGNSGATDPGVPETPHCLGPLSVVYPRLTVTNGSTPTDVSATVTLDPGFTVLPDSCFASVGTCTIVTPTKITWTTTLPANTVESVVFAARIAAGMPINTTLCITASLSFDGGSPEVLQACATTNSADECNVGAPLLDMTGRALLIAALALVGSRVVARRTARRNG